MRTANFIRDYFIIKRLQMDVHVHRVSGASTLVCTAGGTAVAAVQLLSAENSRKLLNGCLFTVWCWSEFTEAIERLSLYSWYWSESTETIEK